MYSLFDLVPFTQRFKFLAMTDKAAVNICVQASVCIYAYISFA